MGAKGKAKKAARNRQPQKAKPPSQQARSSERSKKPVGFHAEGVATAEDAEESIADRAFWERWDTGLLAAWELDFPADPAVPALSAVQAAHRESLIDALVQRKRARPKEGDELAQLQLVWRKKMGVPDTAPAPGLVKAAPASPSPDACAALEGRSALDAEAKEEEEHSDEEGDLEEEEEAPPAKRPRTESNTVDLTGGGEKQQLMQISGPEVAGHMTRVTHRYPLQTCFTCARERPHAPGVVAHTSLQWR